VSSLNAHDIHGYIGDSYVVQGVSLSVTEGRTVAVLGRNGVGKTSLLRTIVGLGEAPRRGKIEWRGRDITALPAWRRARIGIGYLPQGHRVFTSLSVEENLRIAERSTAKSEWPRKRLYELFPVLNERKTQLATSLSGGQQKLLSIARMLVGNPRLIVMDEPTEGLAPIMVEHVRNAIAAVKKMGCGVLLVEQNHEFAGAIADYVHIMQSGHFVDSRENLDPTVLRQIAEQYLGA
jgi:branched-chain amino acid transport system ATP-binding protein